MSLDEWLFKIVCLIVFGRLYPFYNTIWWSLNIISPVSFLVLLLPIQTTTQNDAWLLTLSPHLIFRLCSHIFKIILPTEIVYYICLLFLSSLDSPSLYLTFALGFCPISSLPSNSSLLSARPIMTSSTPCSGICSPPQQPPPRQTPCVAPYRSSPQPSHPRTKEPPPQSPPPAHSPEAW